LPLFPGTTLGHYQILGSLGAGGMGEVYRVKDTKLGRDVALKMLSVPVGNDAGVPADPMTVILNWKPSSE
jgi:serine/threonine protein kinase